MSYFMDFLPFVEVFQLDFLPIDVIISQNILASYSQDFVSVFKIKKSKPYTYVFKLLVKLLFIIFYSLFILLII